MKQRVLLFGGTGVLGSELLKQLKDYEVWAPTRDEIDLRDIILSLDKIREFDPNIIIHAAGLVDTEHCERLPVLALSGNVSTTINLVMFISNHLSDETKLIYISTEYVFDGVYGHYTINDRLNPINVYGKTKAAAEYIVSILPNHQIIRVPFFKKFHDQAYIDQYVSRLTVEEAAIAIIDTMVNTDHIVHISGERDTVYDHYKRLGIKAEPIKIPDHLRDITPEDTSLIDSRSKYYSDNYL